MQFTKAMRKQAKLRLAITGPSGSGKSYSALLLAKGIGGKIAVIDTEKGSASLYSHMVDFDVLELNPPYTPERFQDAVKAAGEAGYDVLIIDSITHEWNGKGGVLEILEELAKAKYRGNTWAAWNDVTPRHRDFTDSLLRSPMHIIATMRSKTETAQSEEHGKKKVVKLGMKSEQREGTEYEFTTVLDLVHDGHYANPSKDRTGLFDPDNPKPVTEATGVMLREWLESGVEVTEEVDDKITQEQLGILRDILAAADLSESALCRKLEVPTLEDLPLERFEALRLYLSGRLSKEPEPGMDAVEE